MVLNACETSPKSQEESVPGWRKREMWLLRLDYRTETYFFASWYLLFCVSYSNDVPNPVVWMHFWREKRLHSRIGRSEGLRSTDPLSRASGLLGKLTRSDLGPIKKWNYHHRFCHQHHFMLQKFSMFESNFDQISNFQFLNFQVAGILSVCE